MFLKGLGLMAVASSESVCVQHRFIWQQLMQVAVPFNGNDCQPNNMAITFFVHLSINYVCLAIAQEGRCVFTNLSILYAWLCDFWVNTEQLTQAV
jgi:hypothetical protein